MKKFEEKKNRRIGIIAGNKVVPFGYIEKLIEQADMLQALIEVEDLSIEMKSTCNYLIGYIHSLKN